MSWFKRFLPTVLLALLATASGFSLYAGIVLNRALTNLGNGLAGTKGGGNPPISWDQQFELAVCLLCIVAMIVRIKWQQLGKGLSLLLFGASLAYTAAMAVLPEAWLQRAFRTQLDRSAAAFAAVGLAISLAWMASHRPSNHSEPVKAAS